MGDLEQVTNETENTSYRLMAYFNGKLDNFRAQVDGLIVDYNSQAFDLNEKGLILLRIIEIFRKDYFQILTDAKEMLPQVESDKDSLIDSEIIDDIRISPTRFKEIELDYLSRALNINLPDFDTIKNQMLGYLDSELADLETKLNATRNAKAEALHSGVKLTYRVYQYSREEKKVFYATQQKLKRHRDIIERAIKKNTFKEIIVEPNELSFFDKKNLLNILFTRTLEISRNEAKFPSISNYLAYIGVILIVLEFFQHIDSKDINEYVVLIDAIEAILFATLVCLSFLEVKSLVEYRKFKRDLKSNLNAQIQSLVKEDEKQKIQPALDAIDHLLDESTEDLSRIVLDDDGELTEGGREQ